MRESSKNRFSTSPCKVVKKQQLLNNKFRESHSSALALAISDILRDYGCRVSFDKLNTFYQKQLQSIEVLLIMKEIKKAINFFCAKKLHQEELPDRGVFVLFPKSIVVWVNRSTRVSQFMRRRTRNKALKLIHSIAQCKNVLAGPIRVHLEADYIKHRDTLSQPAKQSPADLLEKAFKLGSKFGKVVNKLYEPNKTILPKSSATFSHKRSDGGKRSVLLKNNQSFCSAYRAEPIVLFLQGNPGIGKSRLVNEITRELCLRESSDFSKSVFFRNCNTKHWDGYNGQIITVLDDWAQNGQDKSDIVEIISLVTNNAYPLPMADLSEKGRIFTSKYIIICSNLDLNLPGDFNYLDNTSFLTNLQDNRALWRRFEFPIQLRNAKTDKVIYRDLTPDLKEYLSQDKYRYKRFIYRGENYTETLRQVFVRDIALRMRKSFIKKSFSLLNVIPELGEDYPWIQNAHFEEDKFFVNGHLIEYKDEITFSFPSFPPKDIPQVRTQVVAKALGSRMVTCAHEHTQVLKPLQVAMWKALGRFKQFKATHGIDLNEISDHIRVEKDDEFILSGDYESATDNMNMDLSHALLEGILSEIDHLPTRAWARYENGIHTIHYPPWTGLTPIEQSTGQLMGSLLSFPLLCLANELLTTEAGIIKRMINGDDLLAICTKPQYEKWKELGSSVGMKASVGKNYLSQTFGTFNSQLFIDNQFIKHTNLKFAYRKFTIDNCFSDAILNQTSKQLLVRRNHHLLKNCPQSLDISTKYGGLGLNNDREMTFNDKLCYFAKLISKKHNRGNRHLPEGYMWLSVPTLEPVTCVNQISEFKTSEELCKETKLREKSRLLSFKDLKIVKKIVLKNPFLREKIYQKFDFLSLGCFTYKTIIISKNTLKLHQQKILQKLLC